MPADDRLPTALLVDAVLTPLNGQGIFYYITHKGNHHSGTILLKLNGLGKGIKLLTQQRDFDGNLGWIDFFAGQVIDETGIDSYIKRSIENDPDVWVIEIEDEQMNNPFDV